MKKIILLLSLLLNFSCKRNLSTYVNFDSELKIGKSVLQGEYKVKGKLQEEKLILRFYEFQRDGKLILTDSEKLKAVLKINDSSFSNQTEFSKEFAHHELGTNFNLKIQLEPSTLSETITSYISCTKLIDLIEGEQSVAYGSQELLEEITYNSIDAKIEITGKDNTFVEEIMDSILISKKSSIKEFIGDCEL